MTNKQLATVGYLILSALVEGKDWAPEGHLYAALMGTLNLDQFQAVILGLTRLGFVKREPGHVVRLTDEGRVLGEKIHAALQAEEAGVA